MEQLLKLRRFLEPRPAAEEWGGERCEFCGNPIADPHSHVVDIEKRGLLCVCRPCYLLFTRPGAGGVKFRAVSERYARAEGFEITGAQWDELQIPVSMAFFFHNSSAGRAFAFYPSPAGATESSLPLSDWLQNLAPDVEALLVRKNGEQFESYIVPIDACYELVGQIRRHWKGFHGGTEAWREIDSFFATVRERSARAAG